MAKKLTFAEFAFARDPLLKAKWEVYQMPLNDLIGKKVVSIRSGFSSSGGQIMVVESIDRKDVHLKPTDGSRNVREGDLGWMCGIREIPDSFILYTPKNIKVLNERMH